MDPADCRQADCRHAECRHAECRQADCPICLHPMKDRMDTKCNHSFCTDCLSRWMQTRTDCPLCRSSIRSITQWVTIRVIRKCLRKYLKGASVSFVCRDLAAMESHLIHHMFCFHYVEHKTHVMSRNFVIVEYGSKSYEVSFKYFSDTLRASLYSNTKYDQAMMISAALQSFRTS